MRGMIIVVFCAFFFAMLPSYGAVTQSDIDELIGRHKSSERMTLEDIKNASKKNYENQSTLDRLLGGAVRGVGAILMVGVFLGIFVLIVRAIKWSVKKIPKNLNSVAKGAGVATARIEKSANRLVDSFKDARDAERSKRVD